MRGRLLVSLALLSLAASTARAQVTRILISAGTPEDVAIQEITREQDAGKRLALLQDFVQKFSVNPMAVAYGNMQISQIYAVQGDNAQALAYGDKALAAVPNELDILTAQANLAVQMKDYAKAVEYAARGGRAYLGVARQPKPPDLTDQEFAQKVNRDQESAQAGYATLEAVALNAVATEPDPRRKMSEVETFESAFRNPSMRRRSRSTR